MPRRVYFSFHYDDIQRANVVRNSGTILVDGEEVGFYDRSLWEEAQTQGDAAIKELIDSGMVGASVTVVLIGAETFARPWVLYEIQASHTLGMGLLGIHINKIPNWNSEIAWPGPNPFDYVEVPGLLGLPMRLSSLYPVYDWAADGGYNNSASWIEAAAEAAGR